MHRGVMFVAYAAPRRRYLRARAASLGDSAWVRTVTGAYCWHSLEPRPSPRPRRDSRVDVASCSGLQTSDRHPHGERVGAHPQSSLGTRDRTDTCGRLATSSAAYDPRSATHPCAGRNRGSVVPRLDCERVHVSPHPTDRSIAPLRGLCRRHPRQRHRARLPGEGQVAPCGTSSLRVRRADPLVYLRRVGAGRQPKCQRR